MRNKLNVLHVYIEIDRKNHFLYAHGKGIIHQTIDAQLKAQSDRVGQQGPNPSNGFCGTDLDPCLTQYQSEIEHRDHMASPFSRNITTPVNIFLFKIYLHGISSLDEYQRERQT